MNNGDLSEGSALLDADIEWQEDQPSPEAGKHRGRESFERFLRSWLESFDEFRIEPEEIIEHDDRLSRSSASRGEGGPAA